MEDTSINVKLLSVNEMVKLTGGKISTKRFRKWINERKLPAIMHRGFLVRETDFCEFIEKYYSENTFAALYGKAHKKVFGN